MEENTSPTPEKKGISYSVYVTIVVVILLIVVGGLYFYKKNNTQTAMPQTMHPTQTMMQATTTPSASTEATTSSGTMQNETQKITVTGSSFAFDPKTITVKKGQPVELTFKNSGGMHDFVIDEFNVKTQVIPGGQSETVTFTPDKTGTFTYYCSVGNHRAMGMQGKITVE